MVKAEVLPDYYEYLELKPGADPNDIKKQYKKLGMASMTSSMHLR